MLTYKDYAIEKDKVSSLISGTTVATINQSNGNYDVVLGKEESLPCKIFDVLSFMRKTCVACGR